MIATYSSVSVELTRGEDILPGFPGGGAPEPTPDSQKKTLLGRVVGKPFISLIVPAKTWALLGKIKTKTKKHHKKPHLCSPSGGSFNPP